MTNREQLLADLTMALGKYDMLAFDEAYPHELGDPCNPDQLAQLERAVGTRLPPSLRGFLTLHNGWSNFAGDAKILAVEDHGSEWVRDRLDDLATLFAEEDENPFDAGAVPVMLGVKARGFLLIDPRTVRADGEMDFIDYDLTREVHRFTDFDAFLRHKLAILCRLIDKEMHGAPDE